MIGGLLLPGSLDHSLGSLLQIFLSFTNNSRGLTKKGECLSIRGTPLLGQLPNLGCDTASSSTCSTPIPTEKLWRGVGKSSNYRHCQDKAITHTIALCHPPVYIRVRKVLVPFLVPQEQYLFTTTGQQEPF